MINLIRILQKNSHAFGTNHDLGTKPQQRWLGGDSRREAIRAMIAGQKSSSRRYLWTAFTINYESSLGLLVGCNRSENYDLGAETCGFGPLSRGGCHHGS